MSQNTPKKPQGMARLNRLIDLNTYPIQPVLRILLKDHSTGENIIWATDNYSHLGNTYHSAATMRLKDLVKLDKSVIQPRVYKTLELQKQRTKVNAEVFTPSWICCLMNNHLDDVWFGRKDVFNKMKDKSWRATNRPIEFPASGSKTWQGYVDSRRIEITCGEAPYLVSRYDTTTGKVLDITHRIGILDRKLRVVNENANDEAEWIKWTLRAYQATYGYEYQGDNLLIARINMLMTFVDYMQARWNRNPTEDELKAVAFVISWNIWQMNGLTYKTSYDADADRKRLQEIIDECDTEISTYTMCANLPDENCSPTLCDLQLSKEYTLQELIDFVKEEDEISLAYMYAEVHGLKIVEEDKRDFDAEIKQARMQLEDAINEIRLIRDETYAEKCMIIDAPDCLIKNWRMRRTEYFRDIAQKSKGQGIMKFDFCIGNPPYQETRGNSNKMVPIYNNFIDAAINISKAMELITPARFLFNGGITPKEWNKRMLDDNHLMVLDYKADSKSVFPNTDIKGGVAILYRDESKSGEPISVFTPFEELNAVLKKVNATNPQSLSDIIYTETKYNTDTLYHDYPDAKEATHGSRQIGSNQYLKIQAFSNEPKENHIQLLVIANGKRDFKYLPHKYVELNHPTYNKWKVIVPGANGSGAIGEVLSTPLIGTPLIGYSLSFIGVGAFDNESEALNCLKYVKTKFARAMLGVLKTTQNGRRETWKYVPIQDFTENSDIDWSRTIPEIDQQLYKKYGLSQEEIDFIEEKVKEMD